MERAAAPPGAGLVRPPPPSSQRAASSAFSTAVAPPQPRLDGLAAPFFDHRRDLPPARLVVGVPQGSPPDCRTTPGPGAHRLETGGQRFLGRKAGFLVFEQASSNGTVPFAVIDAATGHTLFADTTADGGVDSLVMEGGALRLGFRRGVQGDCAIPEQGAACRARIARKNGLPPAIARLPTPARACTETYRSGKAPKDTPSLVSFPVRLTWAGRLTAEAAGPVRCLPAP